MDGYTELVKDLKIKGIYNFQANTHSKIDVSSKIKISPLQWKPYVRNLLLSNLRSNQSKAVATLNEENIDLSKFQAN